MCLAISLPIVRLQYLPNSLLRPVEKMSVTPVQYIHCPCSMVQQSIGQLIVYLPELHLFCAKTSFSYCPSNTA